MDNRIKNFFEKTDLFLHAQFEAALGAVAPNAVQATFDELISFTKNLSFVEPIQEQARKGWITLLAGSSVHIGFSKLRNASQNHNIAESLEAARNEIDAIRALINVVCIENQSLD